MSVNLMSGMRGGGGRDGKDDGDPLFGCEVILNDSTVLHVKQTQIYV